MELICYLCNGYPSIDKSIEMAKTYVQAGCDIIEIDFPCQNPYLESDLIAGRMAKALEACGDYRAYMDGMARAKKELPGTSFLLLLYESTLLEIGYDTFISFCKENAFYDLILVGNQDDVIKSKLMADSIRVSCYVQYDLGRDEVQNAKNSNGFVYLQAKPTTGKINPDYPNLSDCIAYLRKEGIAAPIYCGVGIHSPEDVAMAKDAGADAVFVGSTILKLHEDKAALMDAIRAFKAKC